jgi:hypothetical protein
LDGAGNEVSIFTGRVTKANNCPFPVVRRGRQMGATFEFPTAASNKSAQSKANRKPTAKFKSPGTIFVFTPIEHHQQARGSTYFKPDSCFWGIAF